jgi:hypothetical protein
MNQKKRKARKKADIKKTSLRYIALRWSLSWQKKQGISHAMNDISAPTCSRKLRLAVCVQTRSALCQRRSASAACRFADACDGNDNIARCPFHGRKWPLSAGACG